ncbi:MAG: NADH-quinone oxidoreductase subunit M [Phycisphaeraceae bacterium]|nr:NADH-quinone oxidoreductase subunit M [Phycisphaeraceae bacterium]
MTIAVLLLLLPLVAVGAIIAAPERQAKWVAFGASSVVFLLSVIWAFQFPEWTTGRFWPEEGGAGVMTRFGVSLELGVDSVSMMLILLTTFLTPLSILGSFTSITTREREFYGWFMVLLSAMQLAFMSRDAILFYVGYEFTLAPMFFLISIWGGPERRAAGIKFFLFTFLGSVLTLAGIVYVAVQQWDATGTWSFRITDLVNFANHPEHGLTSRQQFWVFAALMAGFAVKTPFFPVHTWLPLAHDQAPTAGSVILAGTLLKLGTYGVYRIALPMTPEGAVALCTFFAVLCLLAIVNMALVCWVQRDVKKLIAYSSVSHMGFAMLGLFAFNPIGAEGSVMYMVNHGLSTGALFLCIGMMYERYHTKDMEEIGGLAKRMPVWAFFMVFFTLSSVGLPGLNGFVGEFLCLFGAFTASHDAATGYPGVLGPWFALIGAVGLILGAMYLLIMLGKVVWGPLREPHLHSRDPIRDLGFREIAILTPLALVCLWIGLQPTPLLKAIMPSARIVLADYPAAVQRYHAERERRASEALVRDEVRPAPSEPTPAAEAAALVGTSPLSLLIAPSQTAGGRP